MLYPIYSVLIGHFCSMSMKFLLESFMAVKLTVSCARLRVKLETLYLVATYVNFL